LGDRCWRAVAPTICALALSLPPIALSAPLPVAADVPVAGSPHIATYAGAPGGGKPTEVAQQPFGLAVSGRYTYIADPVNHVVRLLIDNSEVPFAGNGSLAVAGDGTDPTKAQLAGPYAVAVGQVTQVGYQVTGFDVYIADTFGHQVRKAPVTIPPGNPPGSIPQDTYVAIHVGPGGDISGGAAGITVNSKVHVKIYFEGNINIKAQNVVNQSPDTPVYPLGGVYAGSLQFYGISPTTPGQTQSITLTSGGGQVTVAATFYAPSATIQFDGAPDFFGTAVGKSFYANGNITWHYDRALNDDGTIQDYRIASYIEDTR